MILANGTRRCTVLSYAARDALSGKRNARVAWTKAKVHVEFGRGATGTLVHRVRSGVVLWPDDGPPQLAAKWQCGGMSPKAVFTDQPGDSEVCPACAKYPRTPTHVVYYVERDGLIKIGYSAYLDNRVRALRGTLLASEPGTRATERARHEQFQSHRVLGEWFRPGADLLDHIDTLREAAA